ncbi:MAG TPA: shikimate kinase [Pirellulaceae bacterium]|nr:shikimate kinase [Pirellulaceae bacterium]HMO93757.1 shikimate kinase [Pirellulaceae bacterium]HMP71470.1 shikimate kinase [Pirellulaceae bacterium]
MPQHLFLIGFRAAGKTTVGKLLAQLLGKQFYDLDDQITLSLDRSIQQIFREHGESFFRDAETRCLQQLCDQHPAVIALGGGAVLRADNRDLLRTHGSCVWLHANETETLHRMNNDPLNELLRPALTDQPVADEIESIMQTRRPLYAACADYSVETTNLSPEDIAQRIVKWYQAVDTKNRP